MSQIPDQAPSFVSCVNEFPEDLAEAMREFIGAHPHWDQYRLMHAAVAGFLFQHGCKRRAVARHYLDGLFQREGGRLSGFPHAIVRFAAPESSVPPSGPNSAPS